MTITELRDRLNDIIAENDKQFPTEHRNDLTVITDTKVTKRKHEYRAIRYMTGCMTGITPQSKESHAHEWYSVIITEDQPLARY